MTTLIQKQLETVATGREKMARVRVGKSAVVVLSERFFDQVQPLLDFMASQPETKSPDASVVWTEAKNARRAVLIKQKHNGGLNMAERRELLRLQSEIDLAAERAVPCRNEVLELLLLGLKQAAKTRKR